MWQILKFGIKDAHAIVSPHFDTPFGLECCKNDFLLKSVPPLERRRLGVAAKCAFSLLENLKEHDYSFIVFASPFGEINKCFSMLCSLRDDFFISPSAFSLSVLNATPALIALSQNNHCEISAISGFPSLEYGILCAYTKMHEMIHVTCEDSAPSALVLSYFECLNPNIKNMSYYMSALHISLETEALNARIEISKSSHASTHPYSDFYFLRALSHIKDSVARDSVNGNSVTQDSATFAPVSNFSCTENLTRIPQRWRFCDSSCAWQWELV